ncbi:Rv3654c family TadE-like protein [Nakamurella sp. GG22]
MSCGAGVLQPESTVRAGDRGVATVYACLGCVLLLIVTGLAAQLGAASLARQRAESAADLAALAGAARVLRGPDAACATAMDVASANGLALQSCSVVGADVLVIVNAEIRAGPLSGTATARARAGPAAATISEQG